MPGPPQARITDTHICPLTVGALTIVAASAATGLVPSVIGKGIKELHAIEEGRAPAMAATRRPMSNWSLAYLMDCKKTSIRR